VGWAEDRARLLAGEPAPAPPPSGGERRFLRVSDLLAIVRVLDRDGDGTIPVTSWEPDEEGRRGAWHHVTRDRRILTTAAVQAVRSVAGTPWRAQVEVRAASDGWLAVTDPLTGETHEIRAEDAPYAWQRRVGRS
jgi:hypothetical protein